MRDIDKLKAILPNGDLLTEEDFAEIALGNVELNISWNEDGSIKSWGLL